jgi:hypothetical protein
MYLTQRNGKHWHWNTAFTLIKNELWSVEKTDFSLPILALTIRICKGMSEQLHLEIIVKCVLTHFIHKWRHAVVSIHDPRSAIVLDITHVPLHNGIFALDVEMFALLGALYFRKNLTFILLVCTFGRAPNNGFSYFYSSLSPPPFPIPKGKTQSALSQLLDG